MVAVVIAEEEGVAVVVGVVIEAAIALSNWSSSKCCVRKPLAVVTG